MSRARLISFVLVFLASVTGCKSADSKEAAASSGPPCAKVLAAIDRFAAGELFPGATMLSPLPRADGKPFEMGNRRVRFVDRDPDALMPSRSVVGPDEGPIYLLAPDRVMAEDVWWFTRDNDKEYRLVVMRRFALTDLWKMIEEGAPPPKSLESWWAKVKSKSENGFGLDVIGPEIVDGFERTAGRCGGAVSAATGALVQQGHGMGPAEAFRAELPKCKCEGMDEPGFALVVSLMLAATNPRLQYGWLTIDRNAFYVLPPDATVEQLAARLASKEPIPPPPPPPPMPPPARPRGKAHTGG